MNFKHSIIFLIFTFVVSSSVYSQEDILPALDQIVEEIASSSDVELDYTTLYSTLENLYYNPLNLNSATKEDLSQFVFLTEFQVFSILKYKQKYGAYKTLYELQYVDGIDILTLKRLLPFVKVGDVEVNQKTDIAKAFSYGQHTVMTRYQRLLQEKEGYLEVPDSILATNPDKARYLGSPDKVYLRYNYQYKSKLFYGITAEKDDGEQFLQGAQKYGFDYYSAHFQINDVGFVKKLILGDYIAEFGQGLTLMSGMGFGKTSSPTNIIKKARGINKYSSVNESAFLRGEAVTLQFADFTFTEFVSYKSIDASTSQLSDSTFVEEEEYVSSFLESGYHRTPSEIAKRKTVKEFITGGNATWNGSKLRLGLTGVYYGFSSPLQANGQAYRLFDFSGTSNFNIGADYLYNIQKVKLFGEFAVGQNKGYATINGAVFDFVPEFKMSIIHRYYRPDYQALYAQPFSEGNKPNNESGIFIGIEVFPKKYWKIDAYVDSWKFPWLKYGVNAPSTGVEYLVQVNYYPRRNLDMYARVKYETKQENDSDAEFGVRPLTQYASMKYRYHINFTPNANWKFKNRIEFSNYSKNGISEWGYMLYQDVQYKVKDIPLSFTARFAIFETDSYDTRIYAYEPDVLYASSVPAYYGQGTRLAFILKYSILDNLDFWFRIANTYYFDKDELGTGLDAIEGKNRTDIKIQLRYKF